jgi:hypothetical protein
MSRSARESHALLNGDNKNEGTGSDRESYQPTSEAIAKAALQITDTEDNYWSDCDF